MRKILRLLLPALVILTAAACALAEEPAISISMEDGAAVYARAAVIVELENFEENESMYDEPPFQYYQSERSLDPRAVRPQDWKDGWYDVLCAPAQSARDEQDYLYVRAKNGTEWVYAEKTLSFTALENLPEDGGLKAELTAGEDGLPAGGDAIVKADGPANQRAILAGPVSEQIYLNESGTAYCRLSTGSAAGDFPVCMLITRNGTQYRSGIVTLRVGSAGTVGMPAYTVTSGPSIPLNGSLDMTILPEPHTEAYEIRVFDETLEKEIGNRRVKVSGSTEAVRVSIPFSDGAAGDSCLVLFETAAESGYTAAPAEEREDLRFTLEAASYEQGEPRIRIGTDGKGFYEQSDTEIRVFARGAEEIGSEWLKPDGTPLETVYADEYERTNEYLRMGVWFEEPGPCTLRVTAVFPDGEFTEELEIDAKELKKFETRFSCPDYILAEEGAVLSFPAPEGAERLEATLNLGDGWLSYEDQNAADIRLTPGMLNGTEWAVLYLDCEGTGRENLSIYRKIPVLGKTPGTRAALTAAETDVPLYGTAALAVSAPGADEVTLYWEGEAESCQDGQTWVSDPLIDERSYTVFLKARYGDETEYSRPVVIRCVSGGAYTQELRYTLEGPRDGRIARNGFLTVRIPADGGICRLNAELYVREEDRDRWIDSRSAYSEPGSEMTIRIPVMKLNEGDAAYLTLTAEPYGYDRFSMRTETFTVTAPDAAETENGILCSLPAEVTSADQFEAAVYAPGAERVGIGFSGSHSMEQYGEICSRSIQLDGTEPGMLSAVVWAETDGERREIHRTIRVNAPKGKAVADIEGVPEFLEAGKAASLTVRLPEGIRSADIHAEIERDRDNEYASGRWTSRNVWSLDIPAQTLREGSTVWLYVNGCRAERGYSTSPAVLGIPVLTAPGGRVALTVSPGTVRLYDAYTVSGTAQGAERVVIHIPEGDTEIVPGPDGSFRSDSTAMSPGWRECWAAAYFNGEQEYSRPVRFFVNSETRAEPLTAELEGLTDGSVARGDALTVRTSPAEAPCTLYAELTGTGWDEEWIDDFETRIRAGQEGSLRVGTLGLEPGEKYRLRIVRRVPGYDAEEVFLFFRVADFDESRLENGICLDVPDTILTGEELRYAVYAPGASETGIEVSGSGHGADREILSGTLYETFSEERVLDVTADAVIDGETRSVHREITVTAPYGRIRPDLSGVPECLIPGQTAEVSVPLPEGVRKLRIVVTREAENGTGADYEETLLDTTCMKGACAGTIPGDAFRKGDRIILSAGAEIIPGYAWSGLRTEIPVLGESSGLVSLSASDTAVPLKEPVRFEASAPGADRIIVHAFGETWEGYDGEYAAVELYAPEYEGVWYCWADAVFGTAVLRSETVMVQSVTNGRYPDALLFELEGPSEGTISRDRTLKVILPATADGADYRIELRQMDGEYASSSCRDVYLTGTGGECAAAFPMIDLETERNYYVEITRSVPGYNKSAASSESFRLTEFAGTLTNGIFADLPETVMTGETFHYSVYAPGASGTGVIWSREDESQGEAETLLGYRTFETPGERTVVCWADFDGERAEISRTIRVEAPYGIVSADLSRLPLYLRSGEDAELTFGIHAPEGAEDCRYSCRIRFEPDPAGREYWSGSGIRSARTVAIPAEKLEGKKAVMISIVPKGTGCISREAHIELPVVSGTADAGITLSAEPENPLCGQPVLLTVKSDRPMAMIEFTGLDGTGICFPEGAKEYSSWGTATAGRQIVCARVKPADEDRWLISEPISWETASRGWLEPPKLNPEGAVTAVKGDIVSVEVLNAEHSAGFSANLCADGYPLSGENLLTVNSSRIYVATGSLDADRTYELKVGRRAEPGYEQSGEEAVLEIRITGAEPAEEPYITASAGTVYVGEKVLLTACVPGYDELWILPAGTEYPLDGGSYGNGTVTCSFSADTPGEYAFSAAYYDETNSQTVRTPAFATVTVLSKGLSALPEAETPENLYAGTDAAVTLLPLPDAEEPVWWMTERKRAGGQNWDVTGMTSAGSRIKTTIVLSGADMSEGDQIRLTVWRSETGYERNERAWEWTVLGATHTHTENGGEIIRAATCSREGLKEYACTVCGTILRTETIPADPDAHLYSSFTVIREADCTTEGLKEEICAYDNSHKRTAAIPADPEAHDWDDGGETTAPGCETEGVITYTCRHNAAHTRTELIPAAGHSYGEGVVTEEPGCVTQGTMTYTCTRDSSHTLTRPVPALGHSFDMENGTVTTPATCEGTGIITRYCTRDSSHTITETIPATGHDWDEGTETVPATCEEEGVRTYTCLNDPSHTRTEPTDPTGHEWDMEHGTTVREASCATDGIVEYPCLHDGCGKTLRETVPAPGHTWGTAEITEEATCEHEGSVRVECVKCHERKVLRILEKTPHQWDAGTVVREATAEEEGIILFTCGICGEEKRAVIERNPDGPAPEPVMTTLPAGVKRIDADAFAGSAIEGIIIPEDCAAIGDGAFRGCAKLKLVVFEGVHTEFGEEVFKGCSGLTIKCPKGSDAAAYAETERIPVILTANE